MNNPSFNNPPAVERVLSVQFSDIPEFEIVHYGLWYQRITQKFPKFTRESRLLKIFESKDWRHKAQQIQFGLEVTPSLPRLVFASNNEPATRLHQLQPDRFAMNWRRQPSDEYLRFAETKSDFEALFANFCEFCDESGLSKPIIDLCEVIYVNEILCPPGTNVSIFMNEVLQGVQFDKPAEWLSSPIAATVNRVFDTTETGRLYVECHISNTSSGEDCIKLKLTGRAKVEIEDQWSSQLSSAHDWVVNGFVAVTHEQIRKQKWEQQQ